MLAERELDHKHDAALKLRSILKAYVDDQKAFATDDEARKFLVEVIDLTNFMNWRDKAYLIEQLLIEEGGWLTFASMLLRGLRGVDIAANRAAEKKRSIQVRSRSRVRNLSHGTAIIQANFLDSPNPFHGDSHAVGRDRGSSPC